MAQLAVIRSGGSLDGERADEQGAGGNATAAIGGFLGPVGRRWRSQRRREPRTHDVAVHTQRVEQFSGGIRALLAEQCKEDVLGAKALS